MEEGRRIFNLSTTRQQLIALYQGRLARVEHGEIWGSDNPGPYTAEEHTKEIIRIKAQIARLENAPPPKSEKRK